MDEKEKIRIILKSGHIDHYAPKKKEWVIEIIEILALGVAMYLAFGYLH